MLVVIRCYAACIGVGRRRGRLPIPSTGPLGRRAPDDDLFHEPEAHPKTVAAGTLPRSPYVTTAGRREAPQVIQANLTGSSNLINDMHHGPTS